MATGVFTVPAAGARLYYFSTFLLVAVHEYAKFDIMVNDQQICTARGDLSSHDGEDTPTAACNGLAQLLEGKSPSV